VNAPVAQLTGESLHDRWRRTRALTLSLSEPLSDADATVQPHDDASPSKWHLAHTTWFLETFVLRDHLPGYRAFDDRFAFLFNSYYDGEGERLLRSRRGMISRPSLDSVRAYRAHVDAAVDDAFPTLAKDARALIALGIHHEQQHQELFLTDILATFAANPVEPVYMAAEPARNDPPRSTDLIWVEGRSGVVEIGAASDLFHFDCEGPRHQALLHPHAIASRPVSNCEWQAFIADGGYADPALWLSEGWAWVKADGISAPLYWGEDGTAFTLAGRQPIDPAAPVTHVSYYEADAFARWSGARLPTEAEWEDFAAADDPRAGHQLDRAAAVRPRADGEIFGDVWQWTGSAFLPYPGFTPAAGTVGEYNGKFMCGQFVLKGASCATPRGHSRASYRNFFPPAARWQFSGVRLARDL
jgi:ergothioneine biosynthesis protein EgtB